MDIGFKSGNDKFSLRSAALIISENKLLVAKHDSYDCYYTVGGGIQKNETTEQAIIRELHEETGYQFEVERLVFVQERFYTAKNINHHEIVFFYLVKKPNIVLQNGISTDQQNEHLYWVPIDELEKINLVPAFLKAALKNIPNEIVHIVTKE